MIAARASAGVAPSAALDRELWLVVDGDGHVLDRCGREASAPDSATLRDLPAALVPALRAALSQARGERVVEFTGRAGEPIEARIVPLASGSAVVWLRPVALLDALESAVRARDARFHEIADTAPVMIWMSGLDKGCYFFNRPWLEFRGRTLEQEFGDGWAEGVHSDDLERCLAVYVGSFDARRPFSMEYRLRNRAGEYRWILDNGVPRYDTAGTFLGYTGSCIDITERRNAEEELRRSHERLRADEALLAGILASSLDGVLALRAVRDDAGRVADFEWTLVNPAAERITGCRGAELVGRRLSEVGTEGGPIGSVDEYARVVTRRVPSVVEQAYEVNGRRAWLRVSMVPMDDGVVLAVSDVTEARLAGDELRRSRQLLRAMIDHSPDVIFVKDLEGRYQLVNPRWEQVMGHTWEEARGACDEDLVDAQTARLFRETDVAAIADRRPVEYDVTLSTPAGPRSFETVKFALFDESGRAHAVCGVSADVTERRRAEEELRLREAAVQAAANAIVLTDRTGRILWANPAFHELTGYGTDEVVGRTLAVLRPPHQDRELHEAMWSAILGGRVWRGEMMNRRKDGTLYAEEQTITPLVDRQGRVTHFIAIKQGIDWRRETERRLLESEQRYRSLLHGLGATVWEADPQTLCLTFLSERAGGLLGGDVARFLGSDALWRERVHPDDREALLAMYRGLHESADQLEHEYRLLREDGGVAWLHDAVRVLRDPGGRATRLVGVMLDVTRARELERAVRTAAAEWLHTFDGLQAGVVVLDVERRVLRLNRAAATLAGREPRQAVGRLLADIVSGEPWCTTFTQLDELDRQGEAAPRRVTTASGLAWDSEIRALPAGEDGTHGPRVVVMLRDVSRIVALQESVRRAEHMAAMGALVAGVAHEVRNPLFAISVNIDALAAELAGKDELLELVGALRSERERLNALMNELLAYGRPIPEARTLLPVEPVLASAVRSCAELARSRGVRIERRGVVDARAWMDAGRLEQVFDNLIDNACRHAPAGSVVEVVASREEGPVGALLRVDVCDRGPGFSPDVLARLFEPFFTRRRGGTGLGLSIAQRNAEAHGGRVSASSRDGGGAVLRVELPLAPPSEGGA